MGEGHGEGKERHRGVELRQGKEEWSRQSSGRMLPCSGSGFAEERPKRSFSCMKDQAQARPRRTGKGNTWALQDQGAGVQPCFLASWREWAGGREETQSIRIERDSRG